jgi:F420-dependent oxidoreductase-like protein
MHHVAMMALRKTGHAVGVGLKLAPMHCTIEEQRAVWRIADEAGFDHLWVFDHFNPIVGELTGVEWEGWMLLAAMAEATSRVRLGVMVTGNTYRHPAVLAKMAVTVDHLSGGRLEFGLGAGWAEVEHRMLGLEFPPVGERISRFAEACEVIRKLWTEDVAEYEGSAYRLVGAIQNPKPLQKPHPPIWLGGAGERRTLRVVAEHADVWNLAGSDVAEAVRKSQILDGHCEELGRDPATLRRSVQLGIDAGQLDRSLAQAEEFIGAGFREVVLAVGPPDPVAKAELVARNMLPRLRD